MNKKITITLISIIGVVVLGSVMYYYFNRKTNTTTSTPTGAEPNSSTPGTGATPGTGTTSARIWAVGAPLKPIFGDEYSAIDVAKHLNTTTSIIAMMNPKAINGLNIKGGTIIKY